MWGGDREQVSHVSMSRRRLKRRVGPTQIVGSRTHLLSVPGGVGRMH